MQKQCACCKKELPCTEEYFALRTDTGKLNSQCRECKSLIRQKQYLRNREKTLIQSREWKYNNKARRKSTQTKYYKENKERILKYSRDMYAVNIEKERERSKAYREAHKEERAKKRIQRYILIKDKENAQAQEWYKNNKSKHLKNGRAWRTNNRDKAAAMLERYRANKLNASGDFTGRDVKRQYIRQRGMCFWCEIKLDTKYHVDHVVPLSRNGSNDCGNIVISCVSCNSSKGNKYVVEWKRYKQRQQSY